jgi:F0F1-type ATP synthase membrane subunit b/b'
MSAELDLIPKLPVLAVQTGIFLLNVGIIRSLFVRPYLKMRADRENTTTGSKDEAIRLAAELTELTEDVDRRLSESLKRIRSDRDQVKKRALDQRQRLIDKAIEESRMWAQEAEKRIMEAIDLEKQKIPGLVKDVSDAAFNATLRSV